MYMEGYQAFKRARIEHGFSVASFSDATGIKPGTLISYENGDRSLEGLMVYKGLSLFKPLGISPEVFFDEFLHYKSDCDTHMLEWKKDHPRILNYSRLRHFSYDRIVHMKYRGTITLDQYDKMICYYKNTFDYLSNQISDRENLTDEEYESEYLTFLFNIKNVLYMKPDMGYPLRELLKHYFKSEYTAQTFSFLTNNFAALIGYTYVSKLRKILAGELDLDNLSMFAALKLCYVLDLDFPKIFNLGENTCT